MLATWSLVPLPAWTSGCSRFMYCWSLAWRILSLVVQRLKHLPEMWETWVRSLGWEDPLEKEMANQSSILACRIPWTEELGGLQSTGRKESDTTERISLPSFLPYGELGHVLGLEGWLQFAQDRSTNWEMCKYCYIMWSTRISVWRNRQKHTALFIRNVGTTQIGE